MQLTFESVDEFLELMSHINNTEIKESLIAKATEIPVREIEKSVAKVEVPKAEVVAPKLVDANYLAKKYGVTGQTVRSWARNNGCPGIQANGKHATWKFNEPEVDAWYSTFLEHKAECVKKANEASRTSHKRGTKKAKEISKSEYALWRSKMSQYIMRSGATEEGKVFSAAYKHLTDSFGVVWKQVRQDYYHATGQPMAKKNTKYLAWWYQNSDPKLNNIVDGAIGEVLSHPKDYGITIKK